MYYYLLKKTNAIIVLHQGFSEKNAKGQQQYNEPFQGKTEIKSVELIYTRSNEYYTLYLPLGLIPFLER